MKRLAILILVVLAVWWTVTYGASSLGIVTPASQFNLPCSGIDTLNGLERKPDSVQIIIKFGRTANLTSYFRTTGSTVVGADWIDSTLDGGCPSWYFRDTVGEFDADSGSGLYMFNLRSFYQTKPFTREYTFQLLASKSFAAAVEAIPDSLRDVVGDTFNVVSGVLPVNLTQIDGAATNGYNATLKLKMLDISNNAGNAVSLVSSGGNGHGLYALGDGTGGGIYGKSGTGANAHGIVGYSQGSSGFGMYLYGVTGGMNGQMGWGGAGVYPRITGTGISSNGFAYDVAAAVWDALRSDHVTDSTYGTGYRDLQTRAAAIKAKTDKLTFNAQDSLIADYSNMPAGGGGATSLWPLVQGKLVVDSGSAANSDEIFVTDTTDIRVACRKDTAGIMVDQQIIVCQGAHKPIAVGISSVTYSGARVWVTVNAPMPKAFSAADTVYFIGNIANDYATLPEVADTVLGRDTTQYHGDATIGGSIVSGGSGGGGGMTLAKVWPKLDSLSDSLNLKPNRTELPTITQNGLDSLRALAKRLNDSLSSQEWAGGGSGTCSGTGIYDDTVYVRDTLNDVFVAGASVAYDIGATTLYATTEPSGYAVFAVNAGTYSVAATDPPSNYTTKSITVAGSRRDTLVGYGYVTIAPSSPSMCSFQMALDTLSGFADAQIWFSLMPKKDDDFFLDSTSGSIISPDIYTSANSVGVVQQDLNKNKNIKYFKSGEYGKTYWLVRVAKRGADLSSPELKFIINTSDSTNYRVR